MKKILHLRSSQKRKLEKSCVVSLKKTNKAHCDPTAVRQNVDTLT